MQILPSVIKKYWDLSVNFLIEDLNEDVCTND